MYTIFFSRVDFLSDLIGNSFVWFWFRVCNQSSEDDHSFPYSKVLRILSMSISFLIVHVDLVKERRRKIPMKQNIVQSLTT